MRIKYAHLREIKSLQWHGLCPDDMSHAIDMGQIHLTYCGI